MQNLRATRIDVAALVSIIVTVLMLLMFTTNTASAQIKLGKIKNAVAKTLPASAAPAGGGVKTGAVQFDDRVLEITAARLDQFMAGLDAETEMAARVNAQDLDAIDRANAAADAAHAREMAAYDAKMSEHQKCTGAISKDLEKQIKPGVPTEQDQKKVEAVAARIKTAKEAGNMTEVRRLMDSLVAAMTPGNMRMVAASNNAAARASTECGTEPAKPVAPARKSALTWSDVTSAGAAASGMSSEQYAILRERVVPFVLSNGMSSDMMYTPSEVDALKSKSDALGKYGHVLKNY